VFKKYTRLLTVLVVLACFVYGALWVALPLYVDHKIQPFLVSRADLEKQDASQGRGSQVKSPQLSFKELFAGKPLPRKQFYYGRKTVTRSLSGLTVVYEDVTTDPKEAAVCSMNRIVLTASLASLLQGKVDYTFHGLKVMTVRSNQMTAILEAPQIGGHIFFLTHNFTMVSDDIAINPLGVPSESAGYSIVHDPSQAVAHLRHFSYEGTSQGLGANLQTEISTLRGQQTAQAFLKFQILLSPNCLKPLAGDTSSENTLSDDSTPRTATIQGVHLQIDGMIIDLKGILSLEKVVVLTEDVDIKGDLDIRVKGADKLFEKNQLMASFYQGLMKDGEADFSCTLSYTLKEGGYLKFKQLPLLQIPLPRVQLPTGIASQN